MSTRPKRRISTSSDHERRLRALSKFVRVFEAEHAAITEDELELAARRLRARGVPVKALGPVAARKSRKASRHR